MAIYYVDLVNGSDAAAGTSWGTAWKTALNGPTAARISPGDEIRFSKSPDPVNVGLATWTDRKIGNSITFDTAPTKQIDTAKAGWVTMGAGSTVTNGQTTAWVTMLTPGANPSGALQWVTAATTNGCYKDIGSTQDFSGYTQISFWFRSTAGFDCTGSQDMVIELCSDAAATVVVSSRTMPKWNYATNTWYPIVISSSALSSTVRSVRFRTATATTQTFYVDEIFASPTDGLTLWSLIEDNAGYWYSIKSVRNADVVLHAGFSPTFATGATSASASTDYADCPWMGTTANFMTRKRETFKMHATTGPTNTTCIVTTEAGAWTLGSKQLYTYSFGWNTANDTRDGLTFIDNISGLGTAVAVTHNNIRVENVVAVRTNLGLALQNNTNEFNNVGAVSTFGHGLTFSASSFAANVWPMWDKTINILFLNGCNSAQLAFLNTAGGLTVNIGSVWGLTSVVTFSGSAGNQISFGPIGSACRGSNLFSISTNANNIVTMPRAEVLPCSSVPGGPSNSAIIGTFGETNSYYTIGSWFSTSSGAFTLGSCQGTVVNIATFRGTSSVVSPSGSAANGGLTVSIASNESTATYPWVTGQLAANEKLFVHDFGGPGFARVYVGQGSNLSGCSFFDLQTSDVRTGGSKAWKFNGVAVGAQHIGTKLDMKLASVAAEANKLVTVTCYAKKSSQLAGIKVPAIFLPGYTTDRVATVAGNGSFEQLTITFTPTQDCVFDVLATVGFDDWLVNNTAVWDDLTITQAA